jgi:hypothetical protein
MPPTSSSHPPARPGPPGRAGPARRGVDVAIIATAIAVAVWLGLAAPSVSPVTPTPPAGAGPAASVPMGAQP